MGGHAGSLRTYMRLAAQFYWKHIRHDVQSYVQCYLICQQAKGPTTPPVRLLRPLPISQQIWKILLWNLSVVFLA